MQGWIKFRILSKPSKCGEGNQKERRGRGRGRGRVKTIWKCNFPMNHNVCLSVGPVHLSLHIDPYIHTYIKNIKLRVWRPRLFFTRSKLHILPNFVSRRQIQSKHPTSISYILHISTIYIFPFKPGLGIYYHLIYESGSQSMETS